MALSFTVKQYATQYGLERTCARKQLEELVKKGQMYKEVCGPNVTYRYSTRLHWHNPFNLKPGEANAESLAFIQMAQIYRQKRAARAQAGAEIGRATCAN